MVRSNSKDDGKEMEKKKKKKVQQYKGVRMRSWGSWVSEIRAPNQKARIWLGSYSTPEAAARAYDAALLCLKGSSASFNFPSSLDFDVVPSAADQLSAKSIQRLAAAAAAAAAAINATSTSTSTTSTSTSTTPLSPSIASSPVISSDTTTSTCGTDQSPAALELEGYCIDSWFDVGAGFQSPMYMEMMMLSGCTAGAFFDPQPLPQVEDCTFDEVGDDITLWSFC